MKSFLIKVGLLSALTIGLFNGTASAETEWSTKCSLGEIKQNENPSFQQINCLLTYAAINADIPPEVVKAVATKESDWRQFVDGEPFVSADGGIGIMQVTDKGYDTERLANDIVYNIEIGVSILNDKYNNKELPKIKNADRHIIENWYFPVMAYNGIKPINSPLYKDDGDVNYDAYQERVFKNIEDDSFLNDTKLARFPFKNADFDYDKNSDENIKFLKKEYVLSSKPHVSAYFLNKGEKVAVTKDGVNLRVGPGSTVIKPLKMNTPLLINGDFAFDESSTIKNQFVWFPVKTADQKLVGYISSAYIADTIPPVIGGVKNNAYYNKAVTIKFYEGTATLNGTAIKKGAIVSKEGSYTLIVKDKAWNTAVVKFTIDKKKPAIPTVQKTTSTLVIGKAEKGAKVLVYKGSSEIGKGPVRSDGKFSVKIKAMKKNTILKVYVVDKAGNKSSARAVKVK